MHHLLVYAIEKGHNVLADFIAGPAKEPTWEFELFQHLRTKIDYDTLLNLTKSGSTYGQASRILKSKEVKTCVATIYQLYIQSEQGIIL